MARSQARLRENTITNTAIQQVSPLAPQPRRSARVAAQIGQEPLEARGSPDREKERRVNAMAAPAENSKHTFTRPSPSMYTRQRVQAKNTASSAAKRNLRGQESSDLTNKNPAAARFIDDADFLTAVEEVSMASQTNCTASQRTQEPGFVPFSFEKDPLWMTKDWLLSLYERCEEMLHIFCTSTRSLLPWLPGCSIFIPTIAATVVFIYFTFSPSPSPVVVWPWSGSVTAEDNIAKGICSWPGNGPICSFGCGISTRLISSPFPDTCSVHPSQNNIIMIPYRSYPSWWASRIPYTNRNSIPFHLANQAIRCEYHGAKLSRIQHSLELLESDKDALMSMYDEVCMYIRDLSNDLPNHHYYLDSFLEVLNEANVTQQETLGKLRLSNERFPYILNTRQKEDAYRKSPTEYIKQKVLYSRRAATELNVHLDRARAETHITRRAVLKTWSLLRRAGRCFGILPAASSRFHNYHVAVKALDGLSADVMLVESLFVFISDYLLDLDILFMDQLLEREMLYVSQWEFSSEVWQIYRTWPASKAQVVQEIDEGPNKQRTTSRVAAFWLRKARALRRLWWR